MILEVTAAHPPAQRPFKRKFKEQDQNGSSVLNGLYSG